MHWRLEDVWRLPRSYYDTLIEMLKEERET